MSDYTVRASLTDGEDREMLTAAIHRAPELAQSGEAELLVHASLQRQYAERQSARCNNQNLQQLGQLRATEATERTHKLTLLASGTAKRYVVQVATSAGDRVIKFCDTRGVGNHAMGVFGNSSAEREHRLHQRALHIGVAATKSCGVLTLRRGLHLVRAAHVQVPINASPSADIPPLAAQIQLDTKAHGALAAFTALARALARMHAVPFFHADVKGFHALAKSITTPAKHDTEPADYNLLWIDLDRCAFRVTPRRRIINLYQVFRFLLPIGDDSLQAAFIHEYCNAASWYAKDHQEILNRTSRFLRHKLKDHPNP